MQWPGGSVEMKSSNKDNILLAHSLPMNTDRREYLPLSKIRKEKKEPPFFNTKFKGFWLYEEKERTTHDKEKKETEKKEETLWLIQGSQALRVSGVFNTKFKGFWSPDRYKFFKQFIITLQAEP